MESATALVMIKRALFCFVIGTFAQSFVFCPMLSGQDDVSYVVPSSPSLHLSVDPIDMDIATRLNLPTPMGVLVSAVIEDSAADNLGLAENDVIFLVSGRPINDVSTFRTHVLDQAPEESISLTIFRNGSELLLEHQFGKPDTTAQLTTMTRLAELGDPFYQHSLGRYFEGRSDAQALRWHRRAAKSGSRGSMFRLGMYYFSRRSGKPDYIEALQWHQRAMTGTDADPPEAVYQASIILLKGRVGEPDYERGLKLLTRSAGLNHGWAWIELGDVYRFGINELVEKDLEKAFRCYQRADGLNNPMAPFFLGECYEFGRGVTQNYSKAMACYKRVPAWPASMTRLGVLYQFGLGVEKDLAKAKDYYEKASKLGDAIASNNLGGMYEVGLGVDKDRKQAIKFYKLAAEKGFAKSHENLGRIYSEETSELTDLAKAREHYQAAATQGLASAMVSLGFMHVDGKGGEKSNVEALRWFQVAAELGDSAGASALGMMYENGWAVPQDRAEAIAWYLKAAEGNDQWAITRVKELKPETSSIPKP
ncbi:hypothetical protein CKO51_24650 [Rhodopirellula sp. SM50]|nr:PDZ domain-containing protein [Rhodopirellula sp. SM50]PAY16829.1 hypothetical protein CKO51_24650 [Rhodopirellula sp. SM50]